MKEQLDDELSAQIGLHAVEDRLIGVEYQQTLAVHRIGKDRESVGSDVGGIFAGIVELAEVALTD